VTLLLRLEKGIGNGMEMPDAVEFGTGRWGRVGI
jgi:hypothetical protein